MLSFCRDGQALHGSHDLLWCELPAAPDDSRRAHRFRDRLNAAQSAPGRSLQCASVAAAGDRLLAC